MNQIDDIYFDCAQYYSLQIITRLSHINSRIQQGNMQLITTFLSIDITYEKGALYK